METAGAERLGRTQGRNHKVRVQHGRTGELLGRVRGLQTRWTEEDLICVVDDNHRLKKQFR